MAIIQSGASATQWSIDPTSAAGRVTIYDSNGNELAGVGVLYSLNNLLAASGATVTLTLSGQANTSIQLISTTGTLTVSFEANIDGSNWFAVEASPLIDGPTVSSTTSDGVWFVESSGCNQIRAIVTSFVSGSTVVSMIADPESRDLAILTIVGENADNTPNVTTKLPVLSAVASTVTPSWTDGYLVPLSVDDSGNLRVTGTFTANADGYATTLAPSYANNTQRPLSLTTDGALRTDGSAVIQPVSGTVTSNAGTGNFTVVQGTASNLNATIVGTTAAGSGASSGLVTIQGNASGTPIPVTGTLSANADGYATTSAPSYGNNTSQPLSLTTVGALRVDGSAVTQPVSGTGTFTVVQATASNLNATVVQGTSPWVENISQFGGSTVVTGTGASGAGIPRVTVSNDSNILATQSGTWTVQPGNTPNTTPWLATINQGGNSAAVKAASTSAIATDPSLVVALSPNSATPLSSDTSVTGTITTNGQSVSILTGGLTSLAIQVSGTWTGTLQFQFTVDGTNWVVDTVLSANSQTWVEAFTGNGSFQTGIGGYKQYRMVAISAITGTATITMNAGVGNNLVVSQSLITDANNNGPVAVKIASTPAAATDPSLVVAISPNSPLPSGTNSIGTVTANAGTGNFNNASVGATAASPPADATYVGGLVTTSVESGLTNNDMYPLSLTTGGLLRVDGSNATQPVSGTVTANAGTGSFTVAQATAANLNATVVGTGAGGAVNVAQSTAGNLNATVVGTTVAGSGASSGLFTVQGNSSGTPIPVSGTVTASNPSVGATAASPPADATYVGGLVTTSVESGLTSGDMYPLSMTTGGLLRVDGSNVTQPISGTVTANAGTGSFTVAQATAANLNATVTGTVAATQSGTWTVQPGNTANTTPWLATINQGSNSAAVKPASTAAATIDPSLVVALSPNSLTPSVVDRTGSGTMAALNATVVATTGGCSSVSFDVTGTWAGTIGFQAQAGDGTWTTVNVWSVTGQAFGFTIAANQLVVAQAGAYTQMRAIMTAYTSGTASVTWNAGIGENVSQTYIVGTPTIFVNGETPVGTAPYGNPVPIGAINTSTGLTTALTSTNEALALGALNVWENDDQLSGSYPAPLQQVAIGTVNPNIDSFGNLEIRGPVFTDEGSLRDDFSGTTLTTTLTGTLGFTNGSTAVTGVGTSFTTQVAVGQYVKKSTDSETLYAQVSQVISDTSLTLVTAYGGTTATGTTGYVSNWATTTPSGGSIAVASSIMTMTLGTTASATGAIKSLGDYLPYTVNYYAAVSQRIINQTIYLGLEDVVGAPRQQATVQFTGTNNTQVNFVTSFDNASSIQTTTVTLPNSGVTSGYHTYTINLGATQATLSIDNIVVASNTIHLPAPYTSLYVAAGFANGGTAPASSTTLTIDYIFFEDVDRVLVYDNFTGEASSTLVFDGLGNPINSLSEGVSGSTGLMVALGATNYVLSTVNSTTAQLAAGATFTGTIETIYNEQAISILLTSDQPGTLTLNQYIDAAGSFLAQSNAFSVSAGYGFSRSFNANGNYFNLTFKNTGSATTTTLNINTAYGILPSQSNLGNAPVAINEINGVSLGTIGRVPVTLADPGVTDLFDHLVVADRISQLQIPFYAQAPSTLMTITTTGSATTSQGTGTGIFSTGTTTASEVKGVSFSTIQYSAHFELWSAMTASFTAGVAGTYQRFGVYNTLDGFSFGYNGTTFGLWNRYNGTDTFVAQTSWNTDTLTAGPQSKFQTNGAPVVLNPQAINLYRIRFGWLGIAPIIYEILSPDGQFVIVHITRFANTSTTVSITNPNLPLTIDVNNQATTSNLTMVAGCFTAGTTSSGDASTLNGIGTIAALSQSVTLAIQNQGSLAVSMSGTWSGTLTFQYSLDGVTWTNDVVLDNTLGTFVQTTSVNQAYEVNVASYRFYRLIATAWVSGTATVTYSSGARISTVTAQALITDASNNGPAAVKPASTAVVATDPSLSVALSPNTPFAIADKSAMTAGTQIGIPHIGQSYGVGRIQRLTRLGHTNPGYQTLLAIDPIEGATVNSWLWTQSTTTMTIAQTGGLMTLNNSAITTLSTDAIITTNKQFPLANQAPIGCSFKALVTQGTNSWNEMGFGAPAGTTAVISNGAFFRITTSGTIFAVTSTGGTETVSASLGTIVATSYYLFYVVIEDGGARFIIESETGIPLVDYFASLTLATPSVSSAVSHVPAFSRVYITSTAASTAPQTKIASFQAWQYEVNTNRPWSEQLGSAGRQSNISPTAYTQTYNSSLTASPTAVTPTNGTASFAAKLGGDYDLIMTATSGNILSVFSYQVPSPYALIITEIFMPPPVVTVAFTTTATAQSWYLILANNATLSSSTNTYIHPLGTFGVAASAAVGVVFNGQPLQISLKTPITVQPGVYVFIGVRILSGVATGNYTGTVLINGYFE